jgi:hypothetical protein
MALAPRKLYFYTPLASPLGLAPKNTMFMLEEGSPSGDLLLQNLIPGTSFPGLLTSSCPEMARIRVFLRVF